MFYQRVVMVVAGFIMTLVLYMKGRQAGSVSGLTTLSVVPPTGILVQISGDVANPGIYEIFDKKMTNSVIEMSKPFCRDAPVTDDIGQTAFLETGYALLIECKSPENKQVITVMPMKVSQCLTLGIPLDLNRMTQADFDLLPGIGPALAGRIVNHRHKYGNFVGIEELLQIEGIGEKKFQKLSKYFKAPIQQKKRD